MTALVDKLVQRHVEGRPSLKVIGFAFALRHETKRQIADANLLCCTGPGTDGSLGIRDVSASVQYRTEAVPPIYQPCKGDPE